jgi:cardiolipin synthase A/B
VNNDEVNVVIVDGESAAQMETVFARDLTASNEILWDQWRRRTLLSRMEQGIAHLLLRWL